MAFIGVPRTLIGVVLAVLTLCHASPAPRGRPGPSGLRPLLLDADQSLGLSPGQSLRQALSLGVVDDAALMELDQLLNLIQSKGKRSHEQADKGLTRDLVTQVLQPSGAGMWFGPRLGRRRRRSLDAVRDASSPGGRRRRRSAPQMDGDVDNDIAWRAALGDLVRELQGPKRSPCDPNEINCLLANLANAGARSIAVVSSEQQQQPRSEGNLVNFTPRLGRESGESGESGEDVTEGIARQLRTEDNHPLWFSPRLGRRLLPPGEIDVHAGAAAPPGSSWGQRQARQARQADKQ